MLCTQLDPAEKDYYEHTHWKVFNVLQTVPKCLCEFVIVLLGEQGDGSLSLSQHLNALQGSKEPQSEEVKVQRSDVKPG